MGAGGLPDVYELPVPAVFHPQPQPPTANWRPLIAGPVRDGVIDGFLTSHKIAKSHWPLWAVRGAAKITTAHNHIQRRPIISAAMAKVDEGHGLHRAIVLSAFLEDPIGRGGDAAHRRPSRDAGGYPCPALL